MLLKALTKLRSSEAFFHKENLLASEKH